ncbi:MAG: histidine--tRNA ligase [Alphaproteobacteria bacterium]|nr:histidine--tRNA ligase [Alphaproteobacteria bacterium]
MAALQPVRGTHDLLPDEARRHRFVEETALGVTSLYGFGEIVTPIFEFTEVFARTLGDTSDIVTKEMYTFTDKGGDSLTLRPEGTAGVCRAFISGGLAQHLPLKLFYRGPMFRHERPQKGRLRQFHQVGVELLGVEGPQADIEVIAMARHLLDELGIGQHTTLELNTLGDQESREAYRQELVAYLSGHLGNLSEDSRNRLDKNPLRILDSKDEGDRKIVANAPLLSQHLNETSRIFFAKVQEGLAALGVSFTVNERLVRGLDYYGHTAFEFTTTALGSQGTVLAGGRYDTLISTMGGPATPGIGWAAGVERLSMLSEELGLQLPKMQRPVALVPMGEAAGALALSLSGELRRQGVCVELGYSGNLGKRLKRADKVGAGRAVILGEDELAKGVATLRDLDSGNQETVPLGDLVQRLVAR